MSVAYLRTGDQRLPDRSEGTVKQVAVIVDRILSLKSTALQRKDYIEERWLEDLRNYHGRYADDIEAQLKSSQQSRLFANLTRPKTNAWAARLGDMLFPSDEPNWGIAPTPVPSLTKQAKKAIADARAAVKQANAVRGDPDAEAAAVASGQEAANRGKEVKEQLDYARERAEAMQREIEDQFIECDYNIKNRDALLDGCKIGTGILKGPLAKHRVRRGWEKGPDTQDQAGRIVPGKYQMKTATNARPEIVRVDPWLWFPDPDALNVKELEYSLELHMPNDREVRRWGQIPGFDQTQLLKVLEGKWKESAPPNLVLMRGVANIQNVQAILGRHMGWEFHGSLTPDEAALLAAFSADESELKYLDRVSLVDYPAIVWLLDGTMVKWAPHPLDSADCLYSVWNFERDDGSIFGFGVPYLMRNSQAAVNGAWRLTMNNGGIAAGPQVIIDRTRVEPADGNYRSIYGFKVWYSKPSTIPNQGPAISFVQTEVRQVELQNIITMAMKFIDEETNMPVIAMGDSATHITKTAQGMAMLMNSVNVIFRRGVKQFDDQMTTPTVQRMYDWNMAFNEDESIKGDFDVQAKGSSVLLVRELEAQNLMTIAERLTVHPLIGPTLKIPPITRRLFRAHMLPVNELVKDDDQIKAEEAERAKNPPPNPELEKLKVQDKIATDKNNTSLQLADIEKQTRMLELSLKTNVSLASIKADLEGKTADREQKDRHLAVEVAVAEKTGVHAGGEV